LSLSFSLSFTVTLSSAYLELDSFNTYCQHNKMIEIRGIPAFKDNYIWLLINPHNRYALVVDPGTADPVLEVLKKEDLTLLGILITHHHWDHTGGVLELSLETKAPVYGGAHEPIPGLTHPLQEGDVLDWKDELGITFNILDIPGHTLGHIAYYNDEVVFTGDTLFTAGCGKLFEGTAEQMLNSLNKIKNLPPQTQIYCGHEYTLNNLGFAACVEPGNEAIVKRQQEVQILRGKGMNCVPAPLSLELETNPFLRTEHENVIKSLEQHFKTTFQSKTQIFQAIRDWKNQF
jgi:hydroxyacylglutathione hydrolase